MGRDCGADMTNKEQLEEDMASRGFCIDSEILSPRDANVDTDRSRYIFVAIHPQKYRDFSGLQLDDATIVLGAADWRVEAQSSSDNSGIGEETVVGVRLSPVIGGEKT